LKSATEGVFTPWKLANVINLGSLPSNQLLYQLMAVLCWGDRPGRAIYSTLQREAQRTVERWKKGTVKWLVEDSREAFWVEA
jgi:hypothetical protein